jgi:hypothetical protein
MQEQVTTDVYESVADQVEMTFTTQLDLFKNVSSKAVDLIRLDLVIVGAIVSGFAFLSQLSLNVYLAVSLVSFLAALWFCIQAYSTTTGNFGVVVTLAHIEDPSDVETHYRRLITIYNEMREENTAILTRKNQQFLRGLWSSFVGIFFFVCSLLRSIVGSPSRLLEPLPIPLLDVLIVGGAVVAALTIYLRTTQANEEIS